MAGPVPPPPYVPPPPRSWLERLTTYLARHPVLFLLLLTPGIPEYLSGSSNATGFLIAPPVAIAFLLLNLGMYGPGVLLIREAKVRWNAGWGAVAILGLGYAVLEEGIADATLFNPHNPNVGALGSYGHFLGVNWAWLPGIVMVHIVFSIGIPIFLFGLAFPRLRDQSLVPDRRIPWVIALLALDVILVGAIGAGYLHWVDSPLQIAACLATILAAAVLAWRLPAGWPRPARSRHRIGGRGMFGLGLALFPVTALIPAFAGLLGAPAVVAVVGQLAALLAYAALLFRETGGPRSRRTLLGFSIGAIAPLAFVGVVVGLPVPIVLGFDLLAALFFLRIWRRLDRGELDDAAGPPAPIPVPGGVA